MRDLVEEIMRLDIDPKFLLSLAHKQDNVLGVWWYSVPSGELRLEKNKSITHTHDVFKDVAHKQGWVKGRVFSYNGKTFLLLYVDRKQPMSSMKMVDLLHKLENGLNVTVDHVIDSEGHDLHPMFEDVSVEVREQFSVREL